MFVWWCDGVGASSSLEGIWLPFLNYSLCSNIKGSNQPLPPLSSLLFNILFSGVLEIIFSECTFSPWLLLRQNKYLFQPQGGFCLPWVLSPITVPQFNWGQTICLRKPFQTHTHTLPTYMVITKTDFLISLQSFEHRRKSKYNYIKNFVYTDI